MRFLLALLLLTGPLAAHPHTKVEQQAILSIGLERAAIRIRILPSYDEGAEIFAHIDLDGDGKVPEAEVLHFAEEVASETGWPLMEARPPSTIWRLQCRIHMASYPATG